MKIEENKVYETKHGKYIHVKEITYYNMPENPIAYIVTGTPCKFKSDSVTTVIRAVYTEKSFLDLIKTEPTTIKEWIDKFVVSNKREEARNEFDKILKINDVQIPPKALTFDDIKISFGL